VKNRDSKGYYRALNVSPGASRQEIRLAYVFLKDAYKNGKKSLDISRIRLAHKTLSDPKLRKQYDAGPAPRFRLPGRPGGGSRLNSGPLLIGVVAVLLGVLVFAFDLQAHFVTFEVGSDLYWKKTSKPLGTVLDYSQEHQFEDGPSTEAYRIELDAGGEPAWLPALDLHRNCAVRDSARSDEGAR
jgi:curved DNA-binding protein CbpA